MKKSTCIQLAKIKTYESQVEDINKEINSPVKEKKVLILKIKTMKMELVRIHIKEVVA